VTWHTTTGLLIDLSDFSNDEAWQRLMRGLYDPVRRFACSMGLRPADADDAAQEALTAFAIHYGSFDRRKGRLSKWLFGIVYREVLKQRRTLARRHELLLSSKRWYSLIADRRAAETLWERIWDLPAVEPYLTTARSEFSAPTYHAFHRVMVDEASCSETARDLGMSVDSVYAAKHRVLKRLRYLAVMGSIDA